MVNPVTGERELGWVTPSQELTLGEQQYVPSQQMQGGAYRTDPELTRYVASVGARVAARSPVKLPYEFVVLNNSIPNAWALPGGKIAINRGLLTELDNEAELAAVLGHEAVHAAARHGAQAMERGMLLQGALLATALGASGSEYGGLVLGAGQLGAALVTTKYGRDAEREADLYGTRWMKQAGYDPTAAVTLQEKFVRLSQARRSDWLSGLFASHPPSAERVANNRALVAQLGAGGDLGAARFQAATQAVRADKPAYDAYDEGRKALAKGDTATALAKAQAALDIEPREALFHGLRGDVRLRQKQYADAVTNYDRAIGRDDAYFAFPLGRGLAKMESGQAAAAKVDLERSVALLPTAPAYQGLGRIAESEGNLERALAYYEAAGKSDSAVGLAARSRYLALDLPRRPEQYVRTQVVTASGRPVVEIGNVAGADLAAVVVLIRLEWADGRREELRRQVDRLPAGQRAIVALPDRGTVLAAQSQVLAAKLAQ
jgi:predicted Zn-dependent protease